MEKSFDFGRLLKNHEKKHKNKPTQFVSVAGGVQKRLENNLKHRKSSRLTIFDSIRNLSRCASPAPLSEAQQKLEHRKQQLEKWKEEKQKKRKEAASQKKKPFVAGVPHVPLKFVPPPPAPVKPSISGRVTRSQSARNSKQVTDKQNLTQSLATKNSWNSKQVTEKQHLSQSFAPKNASFKPPQLKNIPKVPYVNLMALKPTKNRQVNVTFDPVFHKMPDQPVNEVKQTRSRAQGKQDKLVETKVTRSKADIKPKGKPTKPLLKINSKTFQSSSSSETDLIKSPILRSRKSLPAPPSPSSGTDSSEQSPVALRKATSPIHSTRKSLSDSPKLESKSLRKSMQSTKQFTPKSRIPKSESSSEEKLRSPKSPVDIPMTPEQIVEEAKRISPCVTLSRGKDNARREMKKKLDEGLLDEDTGDFDNIDHFRRQLASEIKRMTEMCETWDRILEQTVLPESIQECVLGAVGQARLLMSQKLQQFGALVERCARPERGAALVTPADLLGFWDMVFMQVENVDMRFKKLEELRARGWVEELPAAVCQRAKPVRVARAKPVGGASRLKEMIAAARKAKKEQLPSPAEKTFEAGFFCVMSPVRSPAPHQTNTPTNTSLLKAVLSSEAQKSASRNSASFAMLRASVLGKSVECEGISLLPQTPPPELQINATPGRSILKQASDPGTKSSKKSIKVVLFDQSDADIPSDTEKDQSNTSKIEKVLEAHELNFDSGLSSMDIENEGKENSRRKFHRLLRQDAIEDPSPVMTRSRRKSAVTQETTQENIKSQEKPRRSARKSKVLEDVEANAAQLTPRTPRRRGATRPEQELTA